VTIYCRFFSVVRIGVKQLCIAVRVVGFGVCDFSGMSVVNGNSQSFERFFIENNLIS